MEEQSKQCSKCKKIKSLDCFTKDSFSSNGLKCSCKECNNTSSRLHRCTTKSKIQRKLYLSLDSTKQKEKARKIKNKNKILLSNAKRRSKNKGIDFNITLEDIVIPEVCPVLGIPIYLDAPKNSTHCPSLDRVDNTKGYVKGNVCVISIKANSLKSNGTISDFRKIIEYMEKSLE